MHLRLRRGRRPSRAPRVMERGLKGIGDIFPPLAGRSPAATARQLYDFKSGARDGRYAALMKPVVAHLTDQDIVDLTAYIVSLQP